MSRRSHATSPSDAIVRLEDSKCKRRDHAPQSKWMEPQTSRSAMPAMPPGMMRTAFFAAAHDDAARRAQLGIFGLHARRHLDHVRDGVTAQSHGIGRAGLTLGV